jgi:L-ascorbate metabolism protein UlaG (beta-lactamase superfamily)
MMRVRRLGWAAVEVECDGATLVIDYVQDTTPMAEFLRSASEPFPAASQMGNTTVALLTHLHADHADPDALALTLQPGAPVLRPASATGNADDIFLTAFAEDKFPNHTLATEVVGEWESRNIGPFRVSSTPAVDGFGDPQLSWIVECGGHRLFHGGDTLFHGSWWRIAHRYGPFNIAFLPINAPICDWPHLQPPSSIEATLTPEEAALAAHILGSRAIVPIHYGSLNKKGRYLETQHPVQRLEHRAADFGIRTVVAEPGEWINLE